MIRIIGELSLSLALLFALLQSTLPIIGYYRRQNPYFLAVARPAAFAQFAWVVCAYFLMTIAFVTNDFSIAYVAENSHPALPLMYRLTAVWGAHEGSILLWILILNCWTIIFTFVKQDDLLQPLVISILGIISLAFLTFLLFTSNPFLAATTLLQGHDLNPLLQDPGFVIHPPMLYIGYVGFAVAFAITQAALIRGKLDATWASLTRQFALAAWCFLTLGITLGSWWAYRVLGWGGFWFWDPVENASLLPWMSGLALIHVLLVCEKKNTAKHWAAILAIVCFSLSLIGTFLVRSGVLISAHTFANDPTRGIFLLILLGLLLAAAITVYVVRIKAVSNSNRSTFSLFSRESALLINSILLCTAMLTVLLGTIYPLIVDALTLGTISVGAPYFNTVMLPLVLIIMMCMGFAPFCPWQGRSLKEIFLRTYPNILLSFTMAATLLWYFTNNVDFSALISLGLSFWIIISVFRAYKLLPGMSLAHVGFAVLVIGIMLSSILSQEREVRIKPGNAVTVGPYQFFFIDTVGIQGANYRGVRANFDVVKNTSHIIYLAPEKRIFTVRNMVMTKVDIHPGIFRDLYMALGEPLDQDYWSVRIYYKPFIRWIWFGGILMLLGGIVAIKKRD
jgi:cytochrome c-type biogenesis protein CcmF